jgi:maltooligosyltrehalose trehalohydrolase
VLDAGGNGNGTNGTERHNLAAEGNGYFSGTVATAGPGTRYRYMLDDDESLYPDPASRFQPDGPFGPSEVIDPAFFAWTDDGWAGIHREGQVLYEMHVGTFTPEGTFEAATRELQSLAQLGVTAIEIMPLADFHGEFGWGYDGVNLFAPTRLYGRPDDFRRFVNHAHSLGLGVILDVVYNHLGPAGNFLNVFSPSYFTDRYKTDWGAAINYDGESSQPVREFMKSNAAYWIAEYHLDGLRLDATTDIFDQSAPHILVEIGQTARNAAGSRSIILIAEHESQQVILVKPVEQNGYGLDCVWNDDFHHAAYAALTGRKEAYFTDYVGTPQEFISASRWGYLYQGQWYKWQNKRRGTPTLGLEPPTFVHYLESHDQVANSLRGSRCHQLASPGNYRTLTALLLLGPGTPMLFQGQEFHSSKPFHYFADQAKDLTELVYAGRRDFLAQFSSLNTPEAQELIPDPSDVNTFSQCKLDFAERSLHEPAYLLHQDLLQLRKTNPVFRMQRRSNIEGAVLGREAFVLRFFGEEYPDAIVLFNLGTDLNLDPIPEPLLAPPEGCLWRIVWSSEDVRYGGNGTPPFAIEGIWVLPGHAAIVLAPEEIGAE